MRRSSILFVFIFVLLACSDDKKSESKRSDLDLLFSKYEKLKLPFSMVDSSFNFPPEKDTINYGLFSKLVSDTIFNDPFEKNRKISLYPLGKIEQDKKESYLVTLAKNKAASAVYLSVFDKGKFTTNLLLLKSDDDDIVNITSIDKKLSVAINKEWTVKNDFYYNRIIYAYNNVGVFTTVLTETNEERATTRGIFNPIDTFPKTFKYSGNYNLSPNSYLFIRDGTVADEYRFYTFFENETGDQPCTGEIRGRFKMISDKEGSYTDNGDPCVLNFSFTSNAVKVKENGSCGNYRGIKCFFNHTFIRQKAAHIIPKKK